MVYEISSESPICKGIIKEAYWELEQKKLLIYVKNNTAYYMYKKGIEQKIQKYLQQQTGLDIRVVFQDIRLSEEQKQELSQKHILKEKEIINSINTKQAEAEQMRSAQQIQQVSESVSKGILFGKECNMTVK